MTDRLLERDDVDPEAALDVGQGFEHGAVLRGALATLGFGAGAVVVATPAGSASLDSGVLHVAALTLLTTVVGVLRGARFVDGVIVAAVVAVVVAGPLPAPVAVVVVAAGVLLARLMERARPFGIERAVRIVLQATSLVAGIFVVMSQTANERLPEWFAHPLPHGVGPMGLLVVGLGNMIVVAALRDLVAAGGTADPFDPPLVLCTTGLYAHLRHPMQLGQIVVVTGIAMLFNRWGAIATAALIAGVLVGPVRWLEARQLAARFGRTSL